LVVAAGFTIIGAISFYRHRLELEQPFAETCWMIAGGLVLLALVAPPVLRPFFIVWTAIGHVLGWVNMRIILGLAFFGIVTPVGWLARLLRKKDPLQLKPGGSSYWIDRKGGRPIDHRRMY
jgi:hypothetical protein